MSAVSMPSTRSIFGIMGAVLFAELQRDRRNQMGLYNTGVRAVVDQYLIDESKKVRNYGEFWSASSAGYCMRRNMFERLKVPHTKEDARKQRVFTVGHIFHQFIQELTKKAGISIAQEIELRDEELMILGHADDLILIKHHLPPKENEFSAVGVEERFTKKHGKLILYDYKSQSSRAFSYKRPNMSFFHRLQLATYMYMLRKDYPELSESRIMKISKDDLRMSEEVLNYSPELEAEVLNYWKTLNDYWSKKKFPSCTCADKEGGFLAKPDYNPFYFEGESCSMAWYLKNKEAKDEKK
jgi:hypothetical protein